MTDATVHVIDDDQSARESLAFLLDCAGIAVRTYGSAVEFLGHADSLEPGCIVTDIRMPEMTGMELIDRLKGLGVPHPVVVITGHADVPMAIRAMKRGVADFVEKPFDHTILEVVREALDRGEGAERLRAEGNQAAALLESLSGREREVLDLLVDGLPNKSIAHELGISARTVEIYRANVMTKMQARSLSELVRRVTAARLQR